MSASEKRFITQVHHVLRDAGLTPEATVNLSDRELLKVKNLGPKGLAWLRQQYPPDPSAVDERVVIDEHERGPHRYRVVQRDHRLVLQREDGSYALLYDSEIGMIPYAPEELL